MSSYEHFAATLAVWASWVAVGVLYDPVAAPESKSAAAPTPLRAVATFAYIETLRLWVIASRRLSLGDGKSTGELIAGVFVMASRKHLNRIVLLIRRGL